MATASGIRAGRAFIELTLDNSKLHAGLRAAEKRLVGLGTSISKFGAGMAALGAAAAGPILAFSKEFAGFGDDLVDMAGRTGVAASSLSELSFALEQSGSNLSAFETGVRGMQKQITALASGSQETAKAFGLLGIKLSDIEGLGVEEQFTLVAEQLSKIEDETLRAGLAMKVFGKSGSQLLPVLADGAAGIEALRKQARQLGLSLSDEDAKKAGALNDSLAKVAASFKAVRIQIGASIAGVLQPFLDSSAKIIANLIEWAKNNRGLVQTIFLVGAGVAAAGAALVALGGAIALAGVAIGGISTILGGAAAALTFLLSPIGLVIAGVVGLGAVVVKNLGGLGAVFEMLKTKFGSLVSVFEEGISVMGQALQSGDIAAAAEVLWASLKLAWTQGILALNKFWTEWKTFFVSVFIEATTSVANIFTKVSSAIETSWTQAWGFIQDAFFVVTGAIGSGFLRLGEIILGVIANIGSAIDYVLGTQIEQSITDAEARLKSLREGIGESVIEGVGNRDQARQKRLKEIEADRQGTLAELEAERQRKQESLATGEAGKLADAQAELEKARAAYGQVVKKIAEDQAKASEAGQAGPQIAANLGDVLEGLDTAKSRTPSASAVFGGERVGQIFGNVANLQLETAKKQLDIQREQLAEQRRTNQQLNTAGAFA